MKRKRNKQIEIQQNPAGNANKQANEGLTKRLTMEKTAIKPPAITKNAKKSEILKLYGETLASFKWQNSTG